MASFNVQLNSKPGSDGRSLLMIRITQDRRHTYRSLDLRVRKADFNPKAKYGLWIRTSNPDHKLLNEAIKDKLREIESVPHDELKLRRVRTEPAMILSEAKPDLRGDKSVLFSDFTKKEIQRHQAKGEFRISVKKQYLINKVLEAMGRDILLADMDVAFLKGYEAYWAQKGNKVNTRHSDLKALRSILNSAVLEGLYPQENNPFKKFKLKTERTVRTKLSAEEIDAIEKLSLKPLSRI